MTLTRTLAAAAFALLAQPALAADKMTLMLDWFINPDHAPIVLAQDKGYFADAGLEVEIVAPADPADPPTLEEIQEFLSDRLASFKKPTRLEVVPELPRNASGKLLKHRLRDEYGK